jgi:hypothetical protein
MLRVASRIDLGSIMILAMFATLGCAVVAFPLVALAAAAVIGVTALVLYAMRAGSMKLWHLLTLAGLTGYMLLNYGFANLTLHVGIPIIIGHTLMFAALALAVYASPRGSVSEAVREPAALCLWALLLLTLVHLLFDIPRHGAYALRDASIILEGVFLILGVLWATSRRSVTLLVKWLVFLFFVLLPYSWLEPWADAITSMSPTSGIFQEVAIVGYHAATSLYMLCGLLFLLLVSRDWIKWPRGVLILLSVGSLLGLALGQARSMYVGLALSIVLLALLGEFRKCTELGLAIALAIVGILGIAVSGVQLSGRLGPMNLTFFQEHLGSLWGARNAEQQGSIDDRKDWYAQVEERILSSTTNLTVGSGFGEPLINFEAPGHVVVRQPHNSNVSILARLGLVGFLFWLMFHYFLLKRFYYVYRIRDRLDRRLYHLLMWLFLSYLLMMIHTSVQPAFEFAYGSIPFYFMMGLFLGITRWRLADQESRNSEPAPAISA